MTKTKEMTALNKVITVVIGALLMGFLWRVRGTSGWGSSWGLLNVGFIFTMFVSLFMGERKKLDFGWLSITAFSFMLASPSWGTLLDQITGVLTDSGIENPIYISIPSALFMMLTMGFGFSTIFGIMLGRGYSDKQWKIKDFIIILAFFYVFDLASSASVSHWVLDLVQPEAGEYFTRGLKEAELDLTPYQAYMEHFRDASWAKKLEGGRNYFASIQAISSTFRSIGALIATRFIVKDKRAANTGLVTSLAFAFSITLCDLFMYFGAGGYHKQAGASLLPSWISAWSTWEYFTGFVAGTIITAFLLSIKKKDDIPEITFSKIPEKASNILYFIVCFIAMIGISIVRPVLVRFEDIEVWNIIAPIIGFVFALVFILLVNKKWGFNAKNISANELYSFLLPAMMIIITVTYMFIGDKDSQNFREMTFLHNIATLISLIAVLVWTLKNNKIKIK